MASMATPQELLTQTEAAITACLSAQSYSIAGRQKSMAQLAELRSLRRELIEEIAAEADSGGSMASLGSMGGAR